MEEIGGIGEREMLIRLKERKGSLSLARERASISICSLSMVLPIFFCRSSEGKDGLASDKSGF
jgi:hypothetical protein